MQSELQEFGEDAFVIILDEVLLRLGLVAGMMVDVSVRDGNIFVTAMGSEMLGDDMGSAA